MRQKIELSHKQAEYIKNSNHRWNLKIGATQCGKTYIDTQYLIPNRIIERLGKSRSCFYCWGIKRYNTKKCYRTSARNMGKFFSNRHRKQ